jgi:hypothetical protein
VEKVVGGSELYVKYAKPEDAIAAAVGKTCDPRLKSQRTIGRERDAG